VSGLTSGATLLKRVVPPIASAVPAFLDWLLSIVERLLVLGISFVIFSVGYQMMKGRADREIAALAKVGESWKMLLLLLVPLFYRTVNRFIEEAHEAFGVKRNLQGAAISVQEGAAIPVGQGTSGVTLNPTEGNSTRAGDGFTRL